MCECPICKSNNSIKLNIEVSATELAYKRKDWYDWNIILYFCMDCKNIFGEKLN